MTESKELRITTATGKEYLDKATEVIARNFTEDPVLKFLLSDLTEEQRLAYLPEYMHVLLKASALNDGSFQEANDWSCAAVWMPPGKRIDNPFTVFQAGLLGVVFKLGIRGCRRMFRDFEAQTEAAKKKYLRDAQGNAIKGYYYLWFIATDRPARGQGLAGKVVSQWQEKAGKENQVVWLEATTARSRDVYARCGFKAVSEIVLGKGTHAATGEYQKDGPGVMIWPMFWRPDFRDETNGEAKGANGSA